MLALVSLLELFLIELYFGQTIAHTMKIWT